MPKLATLTLWAVRIVGTAMSLFHLWIAFAGAPDAYTLRGTHLAFAMALVFLTMGPRGPRSTPSLLDLLLLIAGVGASLYPVFVVDYIFSRFIYIDPLSLTDWIAGAALIIVLIEGTRRMIGWALPATALAFIAYALFISGSNPEVLMEQLTLSTEGIFGIPLSVSATYVMLFILFGSMIERTGAGKLFMDFALALTGHRVGGPAKVACITSGLFGTVSGSAVANVMTTGAFTIPMMKRLGYRPGFAGAVEAVASTGGQIMPPIMGAAAFVMAEFLAVPYLEVAKWALIPALLFYVALFAAVHLEAQRAGLQGLPRAELPQLALVLKERGHLAIPLVLIITVLLMGYSAPFSALCGIASTIPAAMLRKTTRRELRIGDIAEALVEGARNTVSVALACACAGIVIGVIVLTGLGITFTNLVTVAAQNSLVPALMLTMVAGIILGMGMPTTPAYIVQTALLVPALVKLGVAVPAAHMFCFYFAILSAITPPVALAVYAANGLSGASLWATSRAAVVLGLTGYVVPYMFVFGPPLLLIGETWRIALAVPTALLGVVCLAAALVGHVNQPLAIWQRLLLGIAAIVLIKSGYLTDLLGVVLIGAAMLPVYAGRRSVRTA